MNSTAPLSIRNNLDEKANFLLKKQNSIHDSNNNTNNSEQTSLHVNGLVNSKSNDEFEWTVESSEFAKSTLNPVRRLLEQMKIEPNPSKQMIALSIGDPTVLSEIEKPQSVIDAIKKSIENKSSDGYTPSFGTEKARQAVANYYSRPPNVLYKPQDIFLTHGCSHALDMAILVLANRGQNILIPRPGFSIYKTLCHTFGIEVKYYNLIADKDWIIDLEELKSLVDTKTVAIIVNNPSNPCGSVYSREHLKDIIKIAEQYRLPIIADEVYGDMVFKGKEFFYMSEISDSVPIISCNALSKRFIMPGWRYGWLALHDPKDCFKKSVRSGLMDLASRILGPNSLVQVASTDIFENTPAKYYDDIISVIQENAEIAYSALSKLPGISPKKPSGAMYMMIGIDFSCFPDIKDDQEFVQRLVNEQSVFCIPAVVFALPNYIRIVLTMKKEKIIEACDRIAEFIHKNYKAI